MKKIILFCAAGMSTSLLVNKMTKAAGEQNVDVAIEAYSMSEIAEKGPGADCILLGPQVRFRLNDVKKEFPDKPVAVIDMRLYGMMNGEAVLKQAMELMA